MTWFIPSLLKKVYIKLLHPRTRRLLAFQLDRFNDWLPTYCRWQPTAQEKVAEYVRAEWQELGFFYEYVRDPTTSKKTLLLTGSKSGLCQFIRLLLEFAESIEGEIDSHDHVGPHWFKLFHADRAIIIDNGLGGTPQDFQKLALKLHEHLSTSIVPSIFDISDFAANSEYGFVFQIQADDFNPASRAST